MDILLHPQTWGATVPPASLLLMPVNVSPDQFKLNIGKIEG